jgi:hypothetical protein
MKKNLDTLNNLYKQYEEYTKQNENSDNQKLIIEILNKINCEIDNINTLNYKLLQKYTKKLQLSCNHNFEYESNADGNSSMYCIICQKYI